MTLVQVAILAVVQGAAELLPVSSSAHVIVAQKLLGLDPTRPEMTLMLVLLHTGTMFAVICYFWSAWRRAFFASPELLRRAAGRIFLATAVTGAVGLALKQAVEKLFMARTPHPEIELLFGDLSLIAAALFAVGLLIVAAGLCGAGEGEGKPIGLGEACLIGAVQGLCLPFRGFSRSGATISAALLMKVSRVRAEEFSFALAVVLTPPVILREAARLLRSGGAARQDYAAIFGQGLLGMALSFAAGLLALRFLSRWLENGRWHLFGIYCLCASALVFFLHRQGF